MSDRTAPDGRPSPAARELATALHEQLAASRLAWEAALLRSDAALAAGDEAAAREALDDHQMLLAALEDQVGRAVARAIATREAAARVTPAAQPGPDTEPRPAVAAVGARTPGAWRRTTAPLVGAAAALLIATAVVVAPPPDRAATLAGAAHDASVAPTAEVASAAATVRFPPPDEVDGTGAARQPSAGAAALRPSSSDTLPPPSGTASQDPRPARLASGSGPTSGAEPAGPAPAGSDPEVDDDPVAAGTPPPPPGTAPGSGPTDGPRSALGDLVGRLVDGATGGGDGPARPGPRAEAPTTHGAGLPALPAPLDELADALVAELSAVTGRGTPSLLPVLPPPASEPATELG